MKKLFLLLIISFVISSCSDSTIDPEAKIITINQIRSEPGYAWFDVNYTAYTPDSTKFNLIANSFNQNQDTFYIYVKPSCDCYGTTRQFPYFIKILNSAGITEKNFKIISMTSTTDKHPYQSIIKVIDLPEFYLIRNGKAVYSLRDSLNVRNVPGSTNTTTLENLLVESLKTK